MFATHVAAFWSQPGEDQNSHMWTVCNKAVLAVWHTVQSPTDECGIFSICFGLTFCLCRRFLRKIKKKNRFSFSRTVHNIRVNTSNIQKLLSPPEFWLLLFQQLLAPHILVDLSCYCLCRKPWSPTFYFLCNCPPLAWYEERSKQCPQNVPRRQTKEVGYLANC